MNLSKVSKKLKKAEEEIPWQVHAALGGKDSINFVAYSDGINICLTKDGDYLNETEFAIVIEGLQTIYNSMKGESNE